MMMNKLYKNKFTNYLLVCILLFSLMLSSCKVKSEIPEEVLAPTAELVIPTEEILPTATFTLEPTLEPSPTPTEEPTLVPTETATPEPAVPAELISFWTIPIDSGVVSLSTKGSASDYVESHVGTMENDIMNVQVPANYIVAEVHFNQPLPSGTKLQILEQGAVSPWFESAFSVSANDGNSGELITDHQYLIDPPFWEITYHARVVDTAGTVYWEKDLRIFKALPNTCWDGSLPDPVTLYCKSFDGDWNYRDFENFNPNADKFTSGDWEISDEYLP